MKNMTKDQINQLKKDQIIMLEVYHDLAKEDVDAHIDFIKTLARKCRELENKVINLKNPKKGKK